LKDLRILDLPAGFILVGVGFFVVHWDWIASSYLLAMTGSKLTGGYGRLVSFITG
jgi:hypothetical protein